MELLYQRTMTVNKKTSTIIISLVTIVTTLFVNSLSGNPINFNDLGNTVIKEVLGADFNFGQNNSPASTKTTSTDSTNNSKCLPNTVETAKVVRAVDGDTLEVSGGCNEKIRLLYIDTPETVKPNTPVGCFGPQASDYTKKKFTTNQEVYLKTDKEVNDRYGRALRILFFKNEDTNDFTKSFNYELVSKGYGIAKFYSPNITHKKEMLEGEKNAKDKKLGLHQDCLPQ